MFLNSETLKKWIDRVWALGFIGAGIAMLHFGVTPFDTLKGATITFLGIALYFYGSFLKNQFINN
jgi:hypothetical protein